LRSADLLLGCADALLNAAVAEEENLNADTQNQDASDSGSNATHSSRGSASQVGAFSESRGSYGGQNNEESARNKTLTTSRSDFEGLNGLSFDDFHGTPLFATA
jgi:hypothetical protein